MSETIVTLLLIAFAYLFASISGAIIISKLFKLPSPTEHGSKNPGATNVLRLAGKKYAAIVLLFDVAKGVVPVLLASLLTGSHSLAAFCGLMAVIGHMFPLYYRFSGGKGIATAIGCYFAIHTWLGLSAIVIWLIIYRLFTYSSLSSIIMVITTPVVALILYPNEHITLSLVIMAVLALIKHKDNLHRLKSGQEPKTYFTKKGRPGRD